MHETVLQILDCYVILLQQPVKSDTPHLEETEGTLKLQTTTYPA